MENYLLKNQTINIGKYFSNRAVKLYLDGHNLQLQKQEFEGIRSAILYDPNIKIYSDEFVYKVFNELDNSVLLVVWDDLAEYLLSNFNCEDITSQYENISILVQEFSNLDCTILALLGCGYLRRTEDSNNQDKNLVGRSFIGKELTIIEADHYMITCLLTSQDPIKYTAIGVTINEE